MSLLLFTAFEAAAVTPTLPPALPYESAFAALVRRADRAAMLHLGAQPVTYTTELGVEYDTTPIGAPLTGIFDELYVLAKGSADAGVETLGPAVFLRLEDLPVHPREDDPVLTINGADYRISECRPDDLGGVVLALRKLD